ncbi:PREDICTED: uncharacterized protein LOC106802040 [Ceratotherium simum simum]|uniref:Uncharacterized protein LOC106802040 n=1 Tax=Ceratotherium simum simum TaxID=73337 RepID=A0ABM1CWY7_CERSS|nr:PREDICTED: uncharacterized protein LOC106802040 [Ceratotherium simum simum]
MSDRTIFINSNLSSVPWECHTAAAVAPTPPPTPCLYHVVYRGCGETQMCWHGETYCLVGGYRAYGDAPVATPAKVEAEKPVPRRAPKKRRAMAESDKELCCPSPQNWRLQHGGRRLTPQKLAGRAAEEDLLSGTRTGLRDSSSIPAEAHMPLYSQPCLAPLGSITVQ